jgi:hypothetical protein
VCLSSRLGPYLLRKCAALYRCRRLDNELLKKLARRTARLASVVLPNLSNSKPGRVRSVLLD